MSIVSILKLNSSCDLDMYQKRLGCPGENMYIWQRDVEILVAYAKKKRNKHEKRVNIQSSITEKSNQRM